MKAKSGTQKSKAAVKERAARWASQDVRVVPSSGRNVRRPASRRRQDEGNG